MTLPLAGVKVLEFSEHGFVPSAAAALGDWGAEVVKIERLDGDPMRQIIKNGLVADADGFDYMFHLFNRNKRGIALDVLTPEGREVFERLAKWADVYITNQLPRVMRKLHTERADLFALNPRLVFARGHGQGQRGVGAEEGGYDGASFWSRGGVAHMLTPPDATTVLGQRPAIGDAPSGMFLAGGICAALVQVARTGEGSCVDTSLLNGAVWTLSPDLAYTSITGEEAPRAKTEPGSRSPLSWPYKSSDGRWINLVMVDEARGWQPLCTALGLEDMIEAYPDPATRRANWAPICHRISDVIAGLEAKAVIERLTSEGCIFSLVASPDEVLQDPAVLDNGYAMAHPTHPPLRLGAAPVQFDDEILTARRGGPELGEHTREVLAELGYGAAEIAAFFDRGVVAEPPTAS